MSWGDTERKTYAKISGGRLRISVPEGTEGSQKRSGKLKNGQEYTVHELVKKNFTGRIVDIEYDSTGKFGSQWKVTMDDGEEKVQIQVGADTSSATELLSRLPNVDFSKDVTVSPYSIKNGEKTNSGVVLYQDREKVENYFKEKVGEKEYKVKHGFPEAEPGTRGDDYKIYLLQVKKFLIKYFQEHIAPKLKQGTQQSVENKLADKEDDDMPW